MEHSTLLNFYTNPESEPMASAFYQHPYGGLARDIWVSREGFARFFSVSPEYIDDLPVNCKVLDNMFADGETIGYKILETRGGKVKYRITVTNHTPSRVSKILSIATYLWENKC